jgi:hypothetical protein
MGDEAAIVHSQGIQRWVMKLRSFTVEAYNDEG